MTAEDVELVRALQPAEGADLVATFIDEATWRAFEREFSGSFEPGFECAGIGTPGGDLEAHGFGGLREMWSDWLEPWTSYRTTIEDVSEVGDAVVVTLCDHAVPRAGEIEIEL